MDFKPPNLDAKLSTKPGTYDIFKDGRKFGEVIFWPGYEKPSITYSTPPGLNPKEEAYLGKLPNPWLQAP